MLMVLRTRTIQDVAQPEAPAVPSDRITDAITSMMRRGRVPGLSIAVVDRDRLLFAGGYGRADLAAERPATARTAYLWFSMTKIVTATAALRLADEGRLDLDAPVGEYVDYLRAAGTPQPSVKQLLSHTAGLGSPLPIRWVHPARSVPPDPEALLRRLMASRRIFRYPVGERARYSNVGYLAVGQVISVAAGMPFTTYVDQAVLRPLGMSDTGFAYRAGADAATGYVRAPRMVDPLLRRVLPPGVLGHRHGAYLSLDPFYVDGPAYGGLVGHVLDASRFVRMHLRDGELDGQRVLSARTSRQMRSIDQPGKPFDHGIGWFRRPTGRAGCWVEHFGAGAGFWNVMRLYPDRGIGVVIMSNSTSTYNFAPIFALLTTESRS